MKIIAITPDRKTDTIARMTIQGLHDLKCNVIATSMGNFVKKEYSDEEIISHSKDADFIFVIWGKVKGNKPPKYYLVDQINMPEKTVYIDGSEWTSTGYANKERLIYSPWSLRNIEYQKYQAKLNPSYCKGTPWINKEMYHKASWYFKRECYQEDIENLGLYPYNVGCINEYFTESIDYENKDIDVLWSFGHVDTGLRYETVAVCEKLKFEGYNVKFVGGGIPNAPKVSKKEYDEYISRSLIGISAWGAGNSCMRLFEIAAAGTCCMAQKTQIEFISKPKDMIDYIEYSSISEFEEKIRHLLKNKDLAKNIGKTGKAFMKKYHTPAARVQYIFNIIKNSKNI